MTILALLVPALPIASAESDFSSDAPLQTTKHISRLQALVISVPTLFELPTLWNSQPPNTPDVSLLPIDNPSIDSGTINNPVIQRLSAVASSSIWILATYALGSLLVGAYRTDLRQEPHQCNNQTSSKISHQLSNSIPKLSKRIVIGHCAAILLIAFHAQLTSVQSLASLPLFALALPCAAILFWMNNQISRHIKPLSTDEQSTLNLPSDSSDPTWNHRWSRRLVGVSFLACLAICFLTLLGSTLPTYDIDVRQDDWLDIKSKILHSQNAIHAHTSADPQLVSTSSTSPFTYSRSLPALGFAHTLQAINYFSFEKTQTLNLLNVLMIGQAIDAWMFSIAIALATCWAYRSQGVLAGWITGVLLASHPGVHELVRLGLGAGLACLVILLALLWLEEQSSAASESTKLSPSTKPTLAAQREQLGTATAIFILAAWSSFPTLWISALSILPTWTRILWGLSINNSHEPTKLHQANRNFQWFATAILFCIPFLCASWVIWQWNCGTWGEPLSSIQSSTLTISSFSNTFARMLLLSPSNHWLLIPLALAGGILTNKTNQPKNRLASVRLGLGIVALSWTLWFAVNAQLERQWVIATIALLPAAAAAIRTFQQNLGAWFCIPLCWTLLTWACIAIPTWPYCDQRLLAPLQSYSPNFLHPNDDSRTTSTPLAPWYSDWVDAQSQTTPNEQTNKRWWLIGTSDVFFWRVPTCIQSWKNPSQSLPEFSLLKPHRVGYILVDYDGIEAYNMRLETSFPGTPKFQPEAIRGQLEKWVQQGFLQRCDPWGDSQNAACYKVIAAELP